MATVIKAGQTAKLLKFVKPLTLRDHMAEAHAVLRSARARADQTEAEAKVAAAAVEATARTEGYQKGFALGQTEGLEAGRREAFEQSQQEFRQEQGALVSSLSVMVESFERNKEELIDRGRHDVLGLAIEVAERITKRVGMDDSLAAVGNAEFAVRQIGSASDLVIRIHPRDVEAMRRYAGELAKDLKRPRHVTLEEDETIEPGGCVVETQDTRIDATLTEQLKQAAKLMLGEIHAPGESTDAESDQL